jgi:hypothetical protein
MSLWYESLSLCLYDCGEDLEEKAKCILAHLSMATPRSWWEHALQTGNIPDTYINILQELYKELLRIPGLSEQVEIPLLVALAFIDDYPGEQETKFGTAHWTCSVEEYLANAALILRERPELGKLGETIDRKAGCKQGTF